MPPLKSGTRRPEVEDAQHDGRDIELYLGCPRRYLYQMVLGLAGGRDDTAYVRYHRAVYRVLHWMSEQGDSVDAGAMAVQFESAWQDIGPHDDALEPLFRTSAQRILDQARTRSREGIEFGATISVELGGRTITLPVDEMEQARGQPIVRRIRTGRPLSRPDQRHLHAMMLHAGRGHLGQGARFEIQYLTTNENIPVTLDGVMAARLDDVRDALRELRENLSGNREPGILTSGRRRIVRQSTCTSSLRPVLEETGHAPLPSSDCLRRF